MIGTTLAHYRITAALGAGGMGEVYRATDTKLGREVALKVLSEEFASDPQRLDRFEREARAVAALNHPHIVTIHSVEEAEGVRFLTMELIEGRSLDKLIPEGGLDLEGFFELATPLAEAISAAHDKSVIHRDLKPSNVMVDGDGRVKVLDFGLAKLQQAGEASDSTELPTEALTGVGMIVGTVPYMSPEQIEGEIVDHRTDIFSLGVLLYEMATGERPFSGNSQPALMSSILKDAPQSVVDVRSDLPRHLGRIIARCLEKDRRDRYQTARVVFNELKALLRESSSTGASAAQRPGSDSVAAGTTRTSSDFGASDSAVRNEGFWVAVVPFKFSGGDPELEALAEGLGEEIVTGLSRFSYLRVVARSSTAIDPRYVIEGSLRKAGSTLRVAVHLVETDTGTHLWAENYKRPFDPEAVFEVQDDLVPRIVSTVADMHGVLPRSMGEALRSRAPDQLSPYQAVLRSFAYFARLTAEELAAARTALELAVEKTPAYTDAWAMLALLCAQEFGQDFNLLPDSLAVGADAARRAVETGSSNHLAHFSHAQVLFFKKEFEAFRNAAERAVALNPMDGNSIAFLGELLTYAGDVERGLELAARAKQLNPNHPGWYWMPDFYRAYSQGDYSTALAVAIKMNLPGHIGMHVFIAACGGQLGKQETAATALRSVLELRPDFAQVARSIFVKWWNPEHAEHLIDGLRKAGLAIPHDPGSEASSTASHDRSPVSGEARADEGFWIAVLPFRYRGSDPGVETMAEGLADEIVNGLSRFSFLRVISSTSTAKFAGEAVEVGSAGRELGARYVIEGSIRQAGSTLRVSAQLVDTDSGAHLWAETYERPFRPDAVFELQDDLVPRIVSTVGDAHGILPHAMSESLRRKPPDQLTPYEAVLRSFGYGYRRTPEEHAAVRAALERAVEQAPHSADAWAMLALVYVDEQAHGYNRRPDPIGRALQAARRAADAAPSNALAYNALAWATFFLKEFQAFRTAAEQSIALNPLNSPTLAGLGALTAYSGDWERGCALAERALDLNPRHPGWYWLPLFYDAYRRGDYRLAVNVALKLNLPAFFVMHEALAAAYGQLGDREAADKALREMLRLKPDYAQTGRERLEKWFDPELVEHLTDGLRKAGLDMPDTGTAGPEVEEPVSAATAAGRPRERQAGFRRGWMYAAAATVVAIAVTTVMWMRAPADRGAVEIPRLTVLPFADLSSGGDEEWLAAGTHEALLTALQQIGGLRVTSRTSSMRYRETALALPEIARELDVRWLVEGSVSRVGDGVRITAQLVEGATDQQVWAGQYEGDVRDILALQNVVARKIAVEVHAALTPEEERRLARATRVDPEAYRAYIRGLHHFDRVTPSDFRQSVALFQEAIALDPTFAPAHAALAFAYGIAVEYGWISRAEAAPMAQREVNAVRQLDPGSPEALHALADFQFHMDRDFAAAERSYLEAMKQTSSAYVRFGYGWLLSQSGRHAEAVAALEDAVALDPRSALVRGDLGWWLYGVRNYERAIDEATFAIELDPSFPEAHWLLAASYAQLGRFDEALAEFDRYEELYGEPVLWFRGYLKAMAGRREEALKDLTDLEQRDAPGVERAQILLGLGDRNGVIEALEQADAPGVAFQPYLWPGYEAFHDDPRFRAVLEKFGLPSPPTGGQS